MVTDTNTPDLDTIVRSLVRATISAYGKDDAALAMAAASQKAKAAILATHISKDKIRAALVDEDISELMTGELRDERLRTIGRNELRASLRQQLLEET